MISPVMVAGLPAASAFLCSGAGAASRVVALQVGPFAAGAAHDTTGTASTATLAAARPPDFHRFRDMMTALRVVFADPVCGRACSDGAGTLSTVVHLVGRRPSADSEDAAGARLRPPRGRTF